MKFKIKYLECVLKEPDAVSTDTPDKAWECVKGDLNPLQEEMYVLCLNTKNNVVGRHLVGKGGMNTVCITPAEILRIVLLSGACHFILAHNHPSGDVSPSEADLGFTRKLKKAADTVNLHFLDHLVYSAQKYTSLKEVGAL